LINTFLQYPKNQCKKKCDEHHPSEKPPPVTNLLLMSCSMAANARDTSNRTDDPATSRKVSGAASVGEGLGASS